jgi:ABC-type antimicrobial peptide transport system permease subunit
MTAVWMRAVSEPRRGIRGTVVSILLVGLGAGVVISAAAGARRTQTAYPRFLESAHAADVLISVLQTGIRSFYPEVSRLPEVERAGIAAGVNVFYVRPSGAVDARTTALASVDGRFGYTIERPKLLAGRLPRPDRPFETMVNRFMADQLHLSVGDRVTMRAFPDGEPEDVDPEHVPPSLGLKQSFTVVGITVVPGDVIPVAEQDSVPTLVLTPAYFRQFTRPGVLQFDGLAVRLKPGVDLGRFRAKVNQLAAEHRDEVGDEVFFGNLRDHAARVERAIRPQWAALALFAFLAGLAVMLGIGQIISRQVFLDSSEYPILRGLGMTQSQLIGAAAIRVSIASAAGGVLALAVAALASSLFPIGPARLAEPDPGLSVNLAILGVGFVATVVLLLVFASIPALRAASAPAGVGGLAEVGGSEQPSRLADGATRLGLSPTAAAGLRMALEPGHGRTAVPVRSAIIGLIVAIATVMAALTFGTNLNRLVSTPRLYGWNWNVAADAAFGSLGRDDTLAALGSNRSIGAVAGGNYGDLTIDGLQIPAVGIDALKGSVFPTLIEGRAPVADNEIVLGTSTLRSIHRSVGDSVNVQSSGRTRAMKIVGRAVFPFFGRGSFTPTGLGEGAATTASLFPPFAFPGAPRPSYNFYLVRFSPGADVRRAESQLREQLFSACPRIRCAFRIAQPPTDITNYARIRATPLLLAGLLAALGVAMIAHTLVTSVRRRRRDLAVLKTLGFVRGQVSAAVAWQATTFAAVGLLIGIPLGIAAGRWVWTLFADQLGVPPEPIVSAPAVLLAIPATFLVANLIAALPGRMAGRVQPAHVLRTE